jgi:RNA polymerase sigma-70 factor (ECF subfamily)
MHPSDLRKDRGDRPDRESSLTLLRLAQEGDRAALERLCARYLPRLRRWATGRLPNWARDLHDTDDLLQDTLLATLGRLGTFKPRHEGALQAYLRQAVMNRIRDRVRHAQASPWDGPAVGDEVDPAASPLEKAIGNDNLARYESALARLRDEEREAIHLRLELDSDYREIAEALGKPSPDAARMVVSRALMRLAKEMGRDESNGARS